MSERIQELEAQVEALKQENKDLNEVLESLNEILLVQGEPSRLFERVIAKPQPCILLSKNLNSRQIAELVDTIDVVQVKYKDEDRFAFILVLHKADPEIYQPQIIDFWRD